MKRFLFGVLVVVGATVCVAVAVVLIVRMMVIPGHPTELHGAAIRGDYEEAERLLREGAKVNAVDDRGCTPLMRAIHGYRPRFAENYRKTVEVLVRHGADSEEGFLVACSDGRADIAGVLIGLGARVDTPRAVDMTPLMRASERGHIEVVRLLLAKGADVNKKGRDGLTALHMAVLHVAYLNEHQDIVELLVSKGADVNARDSKGQTPLGIAEEKGLKGLVELMRRKPGQPVGASRPSG